MLECVNRFNMNGSRSRSLAETSRWRARGSELLETTIAEALAAGQVRHPYAQALLRANEGFDAASISV